VFKRAKTIHASDPAAIVIGSHLNYLLLNLSLSFYNDFDKYMQINISVQLSVRLMHAGVSHPTKQRNMAKNADMHMICMLKAK
jgi:urease beta subunit